MADYKGFDLNTLSVAPPWGAREIQALKDIIDALTGDVVGGVYDVGGHKHTKLYNPSGDLMVSVGASYTESFQPLVVASASPYIGVSNSTASNAAGSRATSYRFYGTKLDGSIGRMSHIETTHQGVDDDYKAEMKFYINDGDDSIPSLVNMRLTAEGAVFAGKNNSVFGYSGDVAFGVGTTDDHVADFICTDDLAYIRVVDIDTVTVVLSKDLTSQFGQTVSLSANNISVNSSGYLGINEISPAYQLEVTKAGTAQIALHNSTVSDGAFQRYSELIFIGNQSGGEEAILSAIAGAHQGTSDDQAGCLLFMTNDGNDDESPGVRGAINKNGSIVWGTAYAANIATTVPLFVTSTSGSVLAEFITAADGASIQIVDADTVCHIIAKDSRVTIGTDSTAGGPLNFHINTDGDIVSGEYQYRQTTPPDNFALIRGGSCVDTRFSIYNYSGAAGSTSILGFYSSDDNTIGTKTQTVTGDSLGIINFYGVTSNNTWGRAASVSCTQNGNSNAYGAPADITFNLSKSSDPGENTNILKLLADNTIEVKAGTTSVEWGGSGQATAVGLYNYNGFSACGELRFYTSYTYTIGSKVETPSGSRLGKITFNGINSGLNWGEAGHIRCIQNGAAGASKVPSDIIFSVAVSTDPGTTKDVLKLKADETVEIKTGTTKIQYGGTCTIATILFDTYTESADYCSTLSFRRSHSNTIGSNGETQANDLLGQISFWGINSSNLSRLSSYQQVIQTGSFGTAELRYYFNDGGGTYDNPLVIDNYRLRLSGQSTVDPLLTVYSLDSKSDIGIQISGGGFIMGKEITTPGATTDFWKLYSKTDNKMYFQDGANTEHALMYDNEVRNAGGSTDTNFSLYNYSTSASNCSIINLYNSNSDTSGTVTNTDDADILGKINFLGVTSSAFLTAATIQCKQSSTAENSILEFYSSSRLGASLLNGVFTVVGYGGSAGDIKAIDTGGTNLGVGLYGAGYLMGKEITTPSTTADFWKLYSKNDNKLYFQDGAGSEHTVAFV